MRWESSIDPLAERLAGAGRLLLGAIALLVLHVEPIGVFRNQQILSTIAIVYFVYAVIAELTRAALQIRLRWYRTLTHLLDTGFAALLIWVAGDLVTPMRVFGFLAVMSAGLRFGWRAVVATTAAMIVVHGMVAMSLVGEPGFQLLSPGATLAGHLTLAAVLWHLKARAEQRRLDLARFAAWPRTPLPLGENLLRETLGYAATLLRADSAVLVWEEVEQCMRIAKWTRESFEYRREPLDRWSPMVSAPLGNRSFFTPSLSAQPPRVYYRNGDGVALSRRRPIHEELAAELGTKSLLSVCVEGESIQGRLFLAGLPTATTEVVLSAEVVAEIIAARFHQGRAMLQGQASAVAEERVRLARDLHDGLLQSLTGVALHLQTLGKLMQTNPAAAKQTIEDIQEVIASDQRGLRAFIQQLRPYSGSRFAALRLTARLDDLGARFRTQFGLPVDLDTDSLSPNVSEALRQEIYSLVNEAVANVAKHAKATRAAVEIRSLDDSVKIRVSDDGCGFPFLGTWELPELFEMNQGPRTLKERAAALGGSLKIVSSRTGCVVELTVPTGLERT
ncbi:MAG: sensor histidine kinase [Thermoanaerobaculia bacterium]